MSRVLVFEIAVVPVVTERRHQLRDVHPGREANEAFSFEVSLRGVPSWRDAVEFAADLEPVVDFLNWRMFDMAKRIDVQNNIESLSAKQTRSANIRTFVTKRPRREIKRRSIVSHQG